MSRTRKQRGMKPNRPAESAIPPELAEFMVRNVHALWDEMMEDQRRLDPFFDTLKRAGERS